MEFEDAQTIPFREERESVIPCSAKMLPLLLEDAFGAIIGKPRNISQLNTSIDVFEDQF